MPCNVLFISSIDDILTPKKPLRTPEQMQFGISYISAVLKAHGHRTRLVVLSRLLGSLNADVIDRCCKEFAPRVICFTAVSTEYPFISRMARYIKERYPAAYLCVGGPHVSLNPESILSDGFDALCIGEGEYPTLELVSAIDKNEKPSGIKNLWIKQGTQIEKNEPRPFILDLDALPFPDRDMWQEWIGGEGEDERYPVLLGRGCPFECTYCCNHALRRLASGPYVRFRSIDNILKEIKGIIAEKPHVKNIYLEVETIGTDKKWALDLCDKLAALNAALKSPLTFGVNLRIAPNLDFKALFSAFQKSNFTVVNIGVESGSERVRSQVLNRHYSNDLICSVVRLAREYGLAVNFYNLIGVPGETLEDYKQTIAINRLCAPDKAYAHIFYPYPGTKLYATCKEKGLLPKVVNTELERCAAVLDLPGFSKRQIQNSFVWFDYDVYKGKKPLQKILKSLAISKCRSNIALHTLYRKLTYSPVVMVVKRALRKSLKS